MRNELVDERGARQRRRRGRRWRTVWCARSFGEAAIAVEPGEGPLDDPVLGQDGETGIGAANDLDEKVEEDSVFEHLPPVIGTMGERMSAQSHRLRRTSMTVCAPARSEMSAVVRFTISNHPSVSRRCSACALFGQHRAGVAISSTTPHPSGHRDSAWSCARSRPTDHGSRGSTSPQWITIRTPMQSFPNSRLERDDVSLIPPFPEGQGLSSHPPHIIAFLGSLDR